MTSAPPNTSVLQIPRHEAVKPYGKPIAERRNALRNFGRASGASPSAHIICNMHPWLVAFRRI